MQAQLNPVLVTESEEPGWGEAVLNGPILPLVDGIQDYTGCDRLESIRRAAFYVERLWDHGIVLVPSSYVRPRTALVIFLLVAGWLIGNLDPIRWELPYLP